LYHFVAERLDEPGARLLVSYGAVTRDRGPESEQVCEREYGFLGEGGRTVGDDVVVVLFDRRNCNAIMKKWKRWKGNGYVFGRWCLGRIAESGLWVFHSSLVRFVLHNMSWIFVIFTWQLLTPYTTPTRNNFFSMIMMDLVLLKYRCYQNKS
jgi:hypothetical protein